MPQTQSDIRHILATAGLRPRRRLGQHFLIDGNLLAKIVAAAEMEQQDVVLEVGSGTGSLTELLLEQAGWVVAVEVDRGLFGCLCQRLGERENLTLIRGDILESKSRINHVVLRALEEAREKLRIVAFDKLRPEGSLPMGGLRPSTSSGRPEPVEGRNECRLNLVANLPYDVAVPVLVNLLVCGVSFSRYCVTVQKEVAERILAAPSTKDFGQVSVILQTCSSIKKIAKLPPQVFWPQPEVDSTALRMDIDTSRFAATRDLEAFIALVRLAFGHRRKTLHYNLKQEYDDKQLISTCEKANVNTQDRAEAIGVEHWPRLYEALASVKREA